MTRAFLQALGEQAPSAIVDGDAPSPTIAPDSVAQMSLVMRLATTHSAKLGLLSARPSVGYPLSLDKLNAIIGADHESRIVHAEAGASMASVQAFAQKHRWTLAGDVEPSLSVLDWLALLERTDAKDNDPVAQVIAGGHVVLADGRHISVRPAPRRAVGPDLLPAFVRARGRLGVVVAVHLVVRGTSPVSDHRFQFPSEDAATAALAWIRARGCRPVSAVRTGAELQVRLDTTGARGDAVERVLRDVVQSRGGSELDADAPVPETRTGGTLPLSRALVKLAQQLDPAGVLQP